MDNAFYWSKRGPGVFTGENYTYPYNKVLDKVKQDLNQMVHPSQERKHCTFLLASNLAYPQWISLNCFSNIIADMVCFKQYFRKPTPDSNTISMSLGCYADIVILNRSCLAFLPFYRHEMKISEMEKECKRRSLSTKIFDNLKWLEPLLRAVKEPFPPIMGVNKTTSEMNILVYSHVWHKIVYDVRPPNTRDILGMHICEDSFLVNSSENYEPLMVVCSNGESFSNIWDHNCQKHKRQTGYKNRNGTCSPLFLRNLHCQCESYKKLHASENTSNKGKFLHSKATISQRKMKGGQINENMEMYDITRWEGLDEIPCVQGQPLCFKLHQVCVFRLNIDGKIIPCPTGSHMEECKNVPCNAKYKCAGFYCIPHSYVCDGKWDCPHGNDETQTCKNAVRICKNMYHCHKTILCIHHLDICNHVTDCPQGEDEVMCELLGASCPPGCSCFHFAVMCTNTVLSQSDFMNLPFIALFLTSCRVSSLNMLDKLSEQILVVSVPFNQISECNIDNSSRRMHMVASINLTGNELKSISEGCFFFLKRIQQLVLKQNMIHLLEHKAFSQLNTILLIDLSENEIEVLRDSIFFNIPSQFILILTGNYIKHVSGHLFSNVKVLHVVSDCHFVCCVVPQGTECTNQRQKHVSTSCLKLFSQVFVQVLSKITISILFAFGIFFLICSHIIKQQQQERLKENRFESKGKITFLALVQSSLNCDLFILTHMIILCVAGMTHESVYFYLTAWTRSTTCGLAHATATCYFSMYTLSTSVICFARFSIIKYPFQTRFKSDSFPQKLLFVLFCITACFSISASTLNMPFNKYCSPLVKAQNNVTTFVVMFLITFLKFGCLFGELVLSCLLVKCVNDQVFLEAKNRSSIKELVLHLMSLITSHFLCWVTATIAFFISSFSLQNPSVVIEWTLVLVVPLASLTNPFFYLSNNIKILFCTRPKNTLTSKNSCRSTSEQISSLPSH